MQRNSKIHQNGHHHSAALTADYCDKHFLRHCCTLSMTDVTEHTPAVPSTKHIENIILYSISALFRVEIIYFCQKCVG